MARLVAVSVLAYQSGDVYLLATSGAAVGRKQLIEFLGKLPATTHQSDETADILRPIHVVYPARKHLAAKVRAFADYLVECYTPNAPWQM